MATFDALLLTAVIVAVVACAGSAGAHIVPTRCLDDGDPCTVEYVGKRGYCVSAHICDGVKPIPCMRHVCSVTEDGLGLCTAEPQIDQCDDNNPCTVDSCDPIGGCNHVPIECPDRWTCNVGQCVPSADHCQNAGCATSDTCTASKCNTVTGYCVDTTVMCAEVTCAVVTGCVGDQCVYHDSCTDADPRTVCNHTTGSCQRTPGVCDDISENRCLQHAPSADGTECLILGRTECPSSPDPCFVSACDPASGECRATPRDCDDGLACTADSCDPTLGACAHTQLMCDDGCDPSTGECVHGTVTTVADGCAGRSCAIGVYVENYGCIYSPVECAPRSVCNSITSRCEIA